MQKNVTNIVSLFLNASKKTPHKIAIIDKEESISFAELEQHVIKRAAFLVNKGIQERDKVFVFIPMSINLYINILAIFYIGAVAVFIDEWVSLKRLGMCATLTKCKAYIGGGWKLKALSWFSKPLKAIPLKLSVQGKLEKTIPMASHTEIGDMALITFTTGSTGIPKGAVRSHKLLLGQLNALRDLLDENEDIVDMPMLPIVLLLNLAISRTSVIANTTFTKPEAFDATTIYKQIVTYNIERITCSPYYAKALALHYKKNNITKPLQKMLVGGAPVFPKDAKQICSYLCKQAVVLYGSTEAEPMAHITMQKLVDHNSNLQHGLAVGNIHPNTKMAIVAFKDDVVDYEYFLNNQLPIGVAGEIMVSGEHVLRGYINNAPAVERNKIYSYNNMLWHRTGDAGLIDSKGMVRLLGRCQQIIEHQGTTIYPFIIEAALLDIEGVTIGTLIKKENNLMVMVEVIGNKNDIKLTIENLLTTFNIHDALIRFVSIVPRDPRHHSKIDYAALQQLG
jgi:olefin beta-lactone synthetase